MVRREMALADGRRLAFGIACVEPGELSPFDGCEASSALVEVWSLTAGLDRRHPDFAACRFQAADLDDRHTRAAHCRHGLPLSGAAGGVRLSPGDTRWLLARLAAGVLDEVEFTPAPRQRLSPLAV